MKRASRGLQSRQLLLIEAIVLLRSKYLLLVATIAALQALMTALVLYFESSPHKWLSSVLAAIAVLVPFVGYLVATHRAAVLATWPRLLRAVFIAIASLMVTLGGFYGWQTEFSPSDQEFIRKIYEPQLRPVALPTLPSAPIVLRVVYADNPRFTRFSEVQLRQMLATAELACRHLLGLRVKFEFRGTIGITKLFAHTSQRAWTGLAQQIYDPRFRDDAREVLYSNTLQILRGESTSREDIWEFMGAEVSANLKSANLERLANFLVDKQLQGLEHWKALRAADGDFAISPRQPFHEWMYWMALGYGELPFDIVITNQLVASAEYLGNSIHSMVRGGLVVGTTAFSHTSPLRGFAFFSTYIFSNPLPEVIATQEEGDNNEADTAVFAGTYLVHEIGHLLLQLGHPFRNVACVMRPIPFAGFRGWYQHLDPDRCAIGSEPQMTPGVLSFGFDPQLLDDWHAIDYVNQFSDWLTKSVVDS